LIHHRIPDDVVLAVRTVSF